MSLLASRGGSRVAIAISIAVAACGRLHFDGAVPSGPLVVEATYARAAAWNDHVRMEVVAEPRYRQPGTPCDGSEVGPPATCVHAGEQRMVVLEGLSTCAGVTASDALAALRWLCDDTSGTAILYSTGFREGRGLRHLVDAAGWRPDQVHITFQNGETRDTESTTWWSNPVVPLPDAVDVLDQPGTIYVLPQARTSRGYSLEADKIAIVIVPEARLTYSPGPANCNSLTGERAGADQTCLITAGDQRFLWLEGSFDAARAAGHALQLERVRFAQLRGVSASSAIFSAIEVRGSAQNLVVDVTANDSAIYGLSMVQSQDNVVHDVRAFGNGVAGGMGFAGIFMADGSRNVVTKVVTANNFQYGLLQYGTEFETTYSHVTAGNHPAAGIDLQGDGRSTLVQLLAVNNPAGLRLSSSDNLAAQIASAHNVIGLCMSGAPNRVERALMLGANSLADCRQGSVCDSTTSCAGLGGGPTVVPGLDASTALRYKVTTDDPVNPFDGAGQATQAAVAEWVRFAHPLRGWGADGGPFPSDTNLGFCNADCRIWDWRHADGDAALLARDASGAQDPAAVADGRPCPPSVDGDFAISDAIGNTFLVNALERLGDGRGDDDGLCESGEACVRSRYFGADQGRDDAIGDATCVFRDGAVRGVRMHDAAP